jgi:hypothetical protein
VYPSRRIESHIPSFISARLKLIRYLWLSSHKGREVMSTTRLSPQAPVSDVNIVMTQAFTHGHMITPPRAILRT